MIMTKDKKLQFIKEVHETIGNAQNHGGRDSWWYPTAWTVAYNVKMRAFADDAEVSKRMTEVQREYYNAEDVAMQAYDDTLEVETEMLVEDIKAYELVEDVCQAGRSGGWIEVTYTSIEDIDEDSDNEDITEAYNEAKQLEATETQVRQLIEARHKALNEYIGTDAYYTDIVDNLLTDEDIKSEYRERAEQLLELAK